MKGVIEKLLNCGFEITYEEAQALAGGDFVGRAHIAHILMDKGYVSTVKEAFDKNSIEIPYPQMDVHIKNN